jgi:hypothetical protein
MSLDIDLLIDAYTTLKEYIPQKDRQAAADHMFSILSDSGLQDQDLRMLAGGDAYLKRASEEYLDPEDEEADEDTDYNYDQDD